MTNETSPSEDYFGRMNRQAQRGKSVLRTIIFSNCLLLTIFIYLSFKYGASPQSVIGSINTIVICVLLYMGKEWAKWLFVCMSFFQAGMMAYLFFTYQISIRMNIPSMYWIVLTLTLILSVISSLIMLISKGVGEYLYIQSTKY
ncbi:hypothetical protein [Paenibacillus sp. OSY-SE]|uniref:hypothetical protein n=1 Tax=Paenibacillus sp. OSY-SE TaxID=1196323 RepID=UPI0003041FBD|nr:hypothetical protein [Paenibacillus sp. OSY-SE]